MNLTFKRRKILLRCIVLSLSIHLSFAILLQRHTIWLYSPSCVQSSPSTIWLSSMNKETKNEILKTALTPSDYVHSDKKTFNVYPEKTDLVCRSVVSDPPYLSTYPSFNLPPPFDANSLLVANSEILATPDLPSEKLFNLAAYIPKDILIPKEETPFSAQPLPPPSFHPEHALTFQPVMPHIEFTQILPEDLYTKPTGPIFIFPKQPPSPPTLHPSLFTLLPQLPSLEELNTSSYSEEFDIDLVFSPRESEPGYLFALTLIPKMDLQIPSLKQHYIFLVDRSNSIQKERLIHTRSAIYKAIEQLNPEDTFNIIVFDSKMEKLFPAQRAATKSSIAAAKEFIHNIELGSFFSPADLYKPLLLTVPSQSTENEMYTAILFTDGDSLAKKQAQFSLFQQWSQYNQGRVTLHVLAMSGDKQLSSLEAICALNGGQCAQSNTRRGIKRKLLRLMKTVASPLIKNISCHAFSRSPHAIIELHPENTRTHHLYLGQPYTIFGSAETLDDFVLFIQGRSKGRWLNIRKTISFISARKGDESLQHQWAWQKTYDLYKQYLIDKNPEHLTELKTLVDPLHLPTALYSK
ncbi:MAG: VWA domain-containing protein [Chlamydiales bacterium]|nr:VWA domain-containing protein [Chlamydiales bacterium]